MRISNLLLYFIGISKRSKLSRNRVLWLLGPRADNENFKFASTFYRHFVQILSLVVAYPDSFSFD
jgi:hypothetical protein